MSIKVRIVIALTALALGFSLPTHRSVLGESIGHSQTSASNLSQQPDQAIRAVLDAQQAAWNRGDLPAFLQGYWHSPDLTFSGSDGTVRGYDGLLERYRKSYPDKAAMGQLDFSDLEIQPLGSDAALVLGHWHLKRTSGDIGGVFSLVFRRFPEGWRIIHDHTSAQKKTS